MNSTPQDKSVKRVFESNPRVKVDELTPRNNNSTFVGKIAELEIITKGENRNGQPRRFLKGLLGDETGSIRFDLAERENGAFNIGDIVLFDKAMNKVTKEKHHYVEVKRFGTYEVLPSHQDISINLKNNKSEAIVPPPEGDEIRPPRVRQNKPVSNNNNQSSHNHGQATQSNNNRQKDSYNNNNNNNNNRPEKNNQRNNQRQQNNEPRHATFIRPTFISALEPNITDLIVLGQVISVSTTTKTIRDRELKIVKGRVVDHTGSINFDLKLKTPIAMNDTLLVTNASTRVDENGFLYITTERFGFYNVLSKGNLKSSDSENKSKIEYVKKSI